MHPSGARTELHALLREQRPYMARAAAFSVVSSLLLLAPSWYMLEVYDRVVNSRNHLTLGMLTLAVVSVYVVMESPHPMVFLALIFAISPLLGVADGHDLWLDHDQRRQGGGVPGIEALTDCGNSPGGRCPRMLIPNEGAAERSLLLRR